MLDNETAKQRQQQNARVYAIRRSLPLILNDSVAEVPSCDFLTLKILRHRPSAFGEKSDGVRRFAKLNEQKGNKNRRTKLHCEKTIRYLSLLLRSHAKNKKKIQKIK